MPRVDLATLALLVLAPTLCAMSPTPAARPTAADPVLQIDYLEIVAADRDATCDLLEAVHGVTFGEPIAEFGNARTADLEGGGRLAVRGPLRPDEEPVVRPYLLVEDIEAAVEAAEAAGGQIAIPPLEIPGQGTFAIYLFGGIEHGLWQR